MHKFVTLCFLFSLLAMQQTHAMQPGGGSGWKKPIIITSLVSGVGVFAYMIHRAIKKHNDINIIRDYFYLLRMAAIDIPLVGISGHSTDQYGLAIAQKLKDALAAWNRLDTPTQEMLHEEMIRYEIAELVVGNFSVRTTR